MAWFSTSTSPQMRRTRLRRAQSITRRNIHAPRPKRASGCATSSANSASSPVMLARATAPMSASPGGSGSAATSANSCARSGVARRRASSTSSSFIGCRKRMRTSSGVSTAKPVRSASASRGSIGRSSSSRPFARRTRSVQAASPRARRTGGASRERRAGEGWLALFSIVRLCQRNAEQLLWKASCGPHGHDSSRRAGRRSGC